MTGRALRSGVVLALFSLFFGLCTCVQASFRMYRNLELFVSHPAQAALWFALPACAMALLLKGLGRWLKRAEPDKVACVGHPMLVSFFVLLLCWIPYIIVFYPGNLYQDTSNQISSVMGQSPLLATAPPLGTLLMGGLYALARLAMSQNASFFMLVIFQTLILALALSYAVSTLFALRCPAWLGWGSLLFFAWPGLIPKFLVYVGKDTFYLACYVPLLCELAKLALAPASRAGLIRLALFTLGTLTMRLNGVLAVVPAALCSLPLMKKRGRIKAFWATFGTALVCWALLVTVAFPAAGFRKNDTRSNALAQLYEQTAYFSAEHPGEMTNEEEAVLSQMWDLHWLPQLISDQWVDRVRNSVNTQADITVWEYLRVWAAQGIRHPGTYLKSYALMNGRYFDICTVSPFQYFEMVPSEYACLAELSFPRELLSVRRWLTDVSEKLGAPQQITALWIWLTLALSLLSLVRKKNRALLVLAPALGMVFSVTFAPSIDLRYALPVIAGFPVVLGGCRAAWQKTVCNGNSIH